MELMVGIKHKPSIKSLHTFLKFWLSGVLIGRRVLIKNHQPALIQVFSLSLLIKKVRKEEEGCLVDIMAQGVGSFWREGAD